MLFNACILVFLIGAIAILPLKIPRTAKAALMAATIVIALKFHILAFFSPQMFSAPDLPGWIELLFAFLYAAEMFFALFLCGAFLFRAIRFVFIKKGRTKRDGIVDLALLLSASVLAGIGIYGGNRSPEISRYAVEIENLPPEAAGFKIAVLSDLHVDSRCTPGDVRLIVERTNALHPDAVVLLGDNVDGFVAKRGAAVQELKNLRATYGVYGVTGNHEYYTDYAVWNDFLIRCGVVMLENGSVDIPPAHLSIAGIPDEKSEDFTAPAPDLDRAVRNAKYPVVLLSHRPGTAETAARKGCILQLSGHTHGGLFPGLRILVARANGGFVTGLYDVGGMKLFVSRGTGIWGEFPVRIQNPAEIALLTLLPTGGARETPLY